MPTIHFIIHLAAFLMDYRGEWTKKRGLNSNFGRFSQTRAKHSALLVRRHGWCRSHTLPSQICGELSLPNNWQGKAWKMCWENKEPLGETLPALETHMGKTKSGFFLFFKRGGSRGTTKEGGFTCSDSPTRPPIKIWWISETLNGFLTPSGFTYREEGVAPDLDVPGGVEGSQQGVADDVHHHWEAVDSIPVAQHSEPVALQRAGKQGENSWLFSSTAGKH